MLERLGQRIEFGHQQRPAAGDFRGADRTVRGGLRAMRGAECVHDEHIAQRRVLRRQTGIVLAFADVHAAIFQQHDLAGGDIDAAKIVAHEADRLAERVAQLVGVAGDPGTVFDQPHHRIFVKVTHLLPGSHGRDQSRVQLLRFGCAIEDVVEIRGDFE